MMTIDDDDAGSTKKGGAGLLQETIDLLTSGPAIPIILISFGIAIFAQFAVRGSDRRRRRNERKKERVMEEKERLENEEERHSEGNTFDAQMRSVMMELPPSQPIMKVVKCKGCGARNKVVIGDIGECKYCGSFLQ